MQTIHLSLSGRNLRTLIYLVEWEIYHVQLHHPIPFAPSSALPEKEACISHKS